jgi:hypothetical protein
MLSINFVAKPRRERSSIAFRGRVSSRQHKSLLDRRTCRRPYRAGKEKNQGEACDGTGAAKTPRERPPRGRKPRTPDASVQAHKPSCPFPKKRLPAESPTPKESKNRRSLGRLLALVRARTVLHRGGSGTHAAHEPSLGVRRARARSCRQLLGQKREEDEDT